MRGNGILKMQLIQESIEKEEKWNQEQIGKIENNCQHGRYKHNLSYGPNTSIKKERLSNGYLKEKKKTTLVACFKKHTLSIFRLTEQEAIRLRWF